DFGSLHLFSITSEIVGDLGDLKCRRFFRFCLGCAHRSFFHVLGCSQHFLRTKTEPVDLARFGWTLVVVIECGVDATQHCFQWDASVFPGFNQRPIKSRKEQTSSTTLEEVLFNFGEIVEVVFHGGQRVRIFSVDDFADSGLDDADDALRSQIIRKPSRVRNSSTCLMYFDPPLMSGASPPVETTLVSFPISARSRSSIPSTRPR